MSGVTSSIRIGPRVIADDQPVVRGGFAILLSLLDNVEIVATLDRRVRWSDPP